MSLRKTTVPVTAPDPRAKGNKKKSLEVELILDGNMGLDFLEAVKMLNENISLSLLMEEYLNSNAT